MSATSPCRRRRRPQWSELHTYLLELILENLHLADHARFASVCSSWRSVAIKNPPTNKPLYTALSHDPTNLVRRFITSFTPSWNDAWFIGAGLDGWLVIVVDRRNLFLLNKGLNSMIPLPLPPKLPRNLFECKAVLSSPPSSSSGECTVVIKYDCKLLCCRLPSDKSFTKISDSSFNFIWDMVFYEGRLYVLCFPNTVVIFNHLLNKETRLVMRLGDVAGPNCNLAQFVISDNKLLIIDEHYRVWVFKFEQGKSSLIRVENINDNLLLINSFCSVSITADKHKGFRRNNGLSTNVLHAGNVSFEAKVGDPCPLFFFMFYLYGIKNAIVK